MASGVYRRHLSNAVHRLLGLCGVWPTRRTETIAVEALIRRLQPVVPEVPMIRLGPARDGGYILPDDMEAIGACFSPGVDVESGFEMDCAQRGIPVFLADASVDGPPAEHPLFHFTKKFIGVAGSGPERMSLNEWIRTRDPEGDKDLLLQMDIEGSEYEALLDLDPALLRRFRIVVVEFHALNMLWSRPFFQLVKPVFDRLLEHHAIVHVHPNNCCGVSRFGGLEIPRVIEVTAYRRDRFSNPGRPAVLPHPLDHPNVPGADIALGRPWIGGD